MSFRAEYTYSMNEEISDEALMLQYREGDYHAFETLYNRHKQSLYRFMLRLCPNEAVTEELFHDVWLKLINARFNYEPQAKFTSYLFQIAHNCIKDYFRKHATRFEFNHDNYNDIADGVIASEHGQPQKSLINDERHKLFIKALDELPHEQKEVFLLKEETGMSINEIAEMLQESSEAVKSRLRYAIKKLRAGLNDVYE